jgi:hypothetical protein
MLSTTHPQRKKAAKNGYPSPLSLENMDKADYTDFLSNFFMKIFKPPFAGNFGNLNYSTQKKKSKFSSLNL